MTIALSHGGPTVYSSDERSRRVLVGTAKGVVTLEREGDGWREASVALPDKHISAMLIEPESDTMFAGAYHGGLHASTDGGQTWEPRDAGLTQDDVFSLEMARVGGRLRLYCGTEPAHLFVSDDLGRSWAELPSLRDVETVGSWSFPAPPHVGHLKHINFDPRNAETIYASVEVGGLLRSDDAGRSWRDVPGMYEDVHRVVINPHEPRFMYVTGGDGLYASTDGGASWEHWADTGHEIGGYPDQLVFHPRNPKLMFVAAAKDSPGAWRTTHFAGSRISRSRDGGRSWEVLGGGLPDRMQANVEAMCLEAWGEGESCSLFAATTAGEVWASDDAGETWYVASSGLAPISKGGHYIPLSVAGAASA